MKKIWEKWIQFLNVRIYGDCGTPIWRCPGDSQIFENKYYSSLINVVNTVNLGSKSLDFLTLMLFSGFRFTITSRLFSCSQCEELRVQFAVWPLFYSMLKFSCCFIAVSFLWDHWDFMSLHTAFYFQSLKTLYCYFFFYLVQTSKNPVQFTYALVRMSSFPAFWYILLQILSASGLLGATGAHSLCAGTAPNVWIQWVPQHPCIIFLLVPCQVPFLKPIAYPILFHTFPILATC